MFQQDRPQESKETDILESTCESGYYFPASDNGETVIEGDEELKKATYYGPFKSYDECKIFSGFISGRERLPAVDAPVEHYEADTIESVKVDPGDKKYQWLDPSQADYAMSYQEVLEYSK